MSKAIFPGIAALIDAQRRTFPIELVGDRTGSAC